MAAGEMLSRRRLLVLLELQDGKERGRGEGERVKGGGALCARVSL